MAAAIALAFSLGSNFDLAGGGKTLYLLAQAVRIDSLDSHSRASLVSSDVAIAYQMSITPTLRSPSAIIGRT
jgi:hypothetical protein